MIITYAYETESNVYNRMLFVPDGMPWKLTAEAESIAEGTNENPDDFQTDYVLKLIAGSGLASLTRSGRIIQVPAMASKAIFLTQLLYPARAKMTCQMIAITPVITTELIRTESAISLAASFSTNSFPHFLHTHQV